MPEKRISDEDVQGKLHADIAHPINSECRGRLQDVILDAYRDELRNMGRAAEADAVVAQPPQGDDAAVAPPAASPPPAAEKPPVSEGGT